MWFSSEKFSASETISRTLCLTSATSFVLLFAADLLRPGFVSRYVSVHLVLGVAVIAGIWWGRVVKVRTSHSLFQWVAALICALAAAQVVLVNARSLGEYVVLAFLGAVILPFVTLAVLRSIDE